MLHRIVSLLSSKDLSLLRDSNADPGYIKLVCFLGAFKVDA